MTNRGILENNPTLFEGMTASEYTGNALRAINERRDAILRNMRNTNNLDDLLTYQEGLERANNARVFVNDLRVIMQDEPRGFTVQDMRRLFHEANQAQLDMARQERVGDLSLREGVVIQDPDRNVRFGEYAGDFTGDFSSSPNREVRRNRPTKSASSNVPSSSNMYPEGEGGI